MIVSKEAKEPGHQVGEFVFRAQSFPYRTGCLHGFDNVTQIDSGAYGVVHSACTNSNTNCNIVLKQTYSQDPWDIVVSKIDAVVLKNLQHVKWINSNGVEKFLVPRYIDSWICEETYGFVLEMDRWETNMKKKSRDRRNLFKERMLHPDLVNSRHLYTRDEMNDMIQMASRLDMLGVISGDLKPDQLLCKEINNATEMVVTDFGLTNTFGWSNTVNNCPWPDVVPRRLRAYFNQWQLVSNLVQLEQASVLMPGGEILLLGGIQNIPAEFYADLQSLCPGAKFLLAHNPKGKYFFVSDQKLYPPTRPDPVKPLTLRELTELQIGLSEKRLTEREFNDALETYLAQ